MIYCRREVEILFRFRPHFRSECNGEKNTCLFNSPTITGRAKIVRNTQRHYFDALVMACRPLFCALHYIFDFFYTFLCVSVCVSVLRRWAATRATTCQTTYSRRGQTTRPDLTVSRTRAFHTASATTTATLVGLYLLTLCVSVCFLSKGRFFRFFLVS